MGTSSSSVRVRALIGAVVAGAMLVLMAPSIALAANTATFSSASPASGSYSQTRAPKISLKAYDKYGAKRAGIVLYVDGAKVNYACSYIVSGSWNPSKPDYRRFKLTYQVPASLSVGTHTVKTTIHDLKHKNSTYTWKFSVDLATPPATFADMTPTDGSTSAASAPTISTTVADRWDVRGAGSYSMTIDGASVPASIAYTASGNYRAFRISFRVTAALSTGSHSVTASVHDASGRTTSQTWAFTVLAPPPVYGEMPVEGASCGECHAGFPAAHPTTDCSGCHGAGAPPRPNGAPMTSYAPGDLSAHTLACSLESPCHGGGGAFPHTIGTDCTRCHNPSYPTLPQAHAVDALAIKNLHVSTPTFCTSTYCHSSSLTAEHYRRTDANGAKLTCGTCHGSTDAKVMAAIATKDTACTACHDLLGAHPNTATAHTAVGSCVRSGCHSTTVTTVHKNNCMACHAAGTTPSTSCGTCHASGAYHSGMNSAHALSVGGCVAFGCHGVGVGMDAALTHKNNCTRCHNGTDTPSLNCVGCHAGAVLSLHPAATAAHTPPQLFCTTPSCHGTDVAATHLKSARGCTVCHAEGVTPSADCTTCHSGDLLSVHPNAATAHGVTGVSCVAIGCHVGTDAAALHTTVTATHPTPPGCPACHAVGKTPTLICATCHTGTLPVIHARAGGNHASPTSTCIVAGCHLADVTAVHVKNGASDCRACHGGTHPLSARCSDCHTLPIVTIHASADTSHTAPAGFCQTVCHANNVAAIHESKTSCIACHNPDGHAPSAVCADCHAGTPNNLHAWAVVGHTSSNVSCQLPGCHSTDVVTVHIKRPGMGCSSCHAPGVVASTDCAKCHPGDVSTLHTKSTAAHAVPAGVTCSSAPQCHQSSVAAIHSAVSATHPTPIGCAACHAVGVAASTDCSTCHPGTGEFIHRKGDASHGSPSTGCVSLHCHSSDVSVVHNAGPSCLACHAAGKTPSITCTVGGCHPGDVAPRHATLIGTSHDISAGTCVTDGCHGSTAGGANAVTLHANGPGCIACHADNKTASLVCADCHTGSLDTIHTRGGAFHNAPINSCNLAGADACHGRDVIAIHTAVTAAHPTPIGCAACHAPSVTPTARCADCHTGVFWVDIHPVGTKHTPPHGTCVTSKCHTTDVATIHSPNAPTNGPGCSPCHRQGSLTLDCTQCHTIDMTPRHAAQDASHTADPGVCVNAFCHGASDTGVNVASLHANATPGATHAPPNCVACHADRTTPSTNCATCHSADPLVFHTGLGTKHHAPSGACVTDGCHGTTAGGLDVVALHSAGVNAPGCAACHGVGKTPSVVCSTSGCHNADSRTEHNKFILLPGGVNVHQASANSCSGASCHSNLVVTTIHGFTNCTPCHGPGKTPSLVCSTVGCHSEGYPAVHPHAVAAHVVVSGACVSSQCHHTVVDQIHGKTGGPNCLACHATAGGVATTTDCATCHIHTDGSRGKLPSKDSTPTPHPTPTAADATHTVPATSCSAAGCHSTNLATIHATPTTNHPTPPGCMACHGDGQTPSKTCTTCHSGFGSTHPAPADKHTAAAISCTQSSCHGTVVSLIHVKGGVSHCEACHATGVTPSLVCSNAACHGAGFPPTHPAPPSAHTSADACTSLCHVHNVATIHTTATANHPVPPGCDACHATSKTASLSCAPCHTAGAYHTGAAASHSVSNNCTRSGCHSSGDVSVIHVKNSVQHCEACHGAGITPSTACSQVACHGPGVFPASHPAPSGLHTTTDTCTNLCHRTNVATIHTTATANHPVPPGCDACHAADKTPSLVCSSCHSGGTYHNALPGSHLVSSGCTSSSCHNNDVSVIHVKNGTQNCYACHTSGTTPTTNCSACHGGGSNHTASHAECNNCHGGLEHGGGPTIGVDSCYDCHNQGGAWQHPYLDCHGCQDPGGQMWYGLW